MKLFKVNGKRWNLEFNATTTPQHIRKTNAVKTISNVKKKETINRSSYLEQIKFILLNRKVQPTTSIILTKYYLGLMSSKYFQIIKLNIIESPDIVSKNMRVCNMSEDYKKYRSIIDMWDDAGEQDFFKLVRQLDNRFYFCQFKNLFEHIWWKLMPNSTRCLVVENVDGFSANYFGSRLFLPIIWTLNLRFVGFFKQDVNIWKYKH
jgi:hypothetical protein